MTTSIDIPSVNSLLVKLNSSGINISPKALIFLKELGLNGSELEEIIQKLSFSPIFNSHITMKTIQSDFLEVFKKFERSSSNIRNFPSNDLQEKEKLTENKIKNESKEPSQTNVNVSGQKLLSPILKIDL